PQPQRLAGKELEADAIHGVDDRVVRVESDDEVLDAQQRAVVGGRARRSGPGGALTAGSWRFGHGSQRRFRAPRGSSASRNPSPMKLIASTVIAIAIAGPIQTHGFSMIVPTSMAPLSIWPQLG